MFNNVSEMLTWLIVGWVVWPGSFFLVGIIGESRIPPFWKHQSKAFFPGDLTLPVMWIAIIRINMTENLLIGAVASAIGIVVAVAIYVTVFYVFIKIAIADRKNYPSRAANSPTKIYHDVMGFILFPLLMTPQCVFYVISHIENNVGITWSLLWVFIPLALYILCVVYDMHKGFTAQDIKARHPEDWKPIWQSICEHHR